MLAAERPLSTGAARTLAILLTGGRPRGDEHGLAHRGASLDGRVRGGGLLEREALHEREEAALGGRGERPLLEVAQPAGTLGDPGADRGRDRQSAREEVAGGELGRGA